MGNFKYRAFVLIFVLSILYPSLLASQKITFTYNPPDGTHCMKTQVGHDIVKFMSYLGAEKTVVESTIDFNKSDSGWIETHNLINIDQSNTSEYTSDTLINNLQNKPIKYIIDKSGNLVDIGGIQEQAAMDDSMYTPEYKYVMSGFYRDSADYKHISREWFKKIGCLNNKSFWIGQEWQIIDTVYLNIVSYYIYTTTVSIADTITYDNHKCVKVSYRYIENRNEARLLIEHAYEKMLEIPYEMRDKFALTGNYGSGFGERIIDPSTMLIYKEIENRFENTEFILPSGTDAHLSVGSTFEVEYQYTIDET